MARISEKALRPRQYVFNRLTPDRISKLAGRVKKLKEQEQSEAQSASLALRDVRRHEAARHAENIIAGITKIDPETEQIGALERELEELRERKRMLYRSLRSSIANKEGADSAGASTKVDNNQPMTDKDVKKENPSQPKSGPGGPATKDGDAQEKNGRSDGREGSAAGKEQVGESKS